MKTIDQSRDSFSFARLQALTRRYFVENRRTMLTGALCTIGVLALIGILVGRYTDDPTDSVSSAAVYGVIVFYLFPLFACITGSLTFGPFKSKTGRIHAMMLPATKSEKFVMLTFIYTVLADLIYIIAYFIGDLCRGLISSTPLLWSVLGDIANVIASEPSPAIAVALGAVLLILTHQAIYTLGSSLWPKLSFIKTFGAIFALQFAGAMLVPVLGLSDIFWIFADFTDNDFFRLFWATDCVIALIVAAIYTGAWLRFRHLQVVQRLLN